MHPHDWRSSPERPPRNQHQEGSGLHETLEPGHSQRGAEAPACWAHPPTAGVRRRQAARKLKIPPHVPPDPGPWPARPQRDPNDPDSGHLGSTWPPDTGQVCGHHVGHCLQGTEGTGKQVRSLTPTKDASPCSPREQERPPLTQQAAWTRKRSGGCRPPPTGRTGVCWVLSRTLWARRHLRGDSKSESRTGLQERGPRQGQDCSRMPAQARGLAGAWPGTSGCKQVT